MSFPRYERYKDSNYGNGELPITWSEVRLKTILAQKITDGPHETPDFTEFGIPFLSVDGIQNGELVFAGCRYISEEAHWLYRKKVQPRRDDILLAKAASTGKIARVKTDIEFNIWSPLAVIRLDTSRSIPAFVEYVLQSPESQAQVEMLCTANTQKNISMDDIPLIAFALPPRDIQSAIVTFLQRGTDKIDALIEEQRRLIELLKEKRQAVISHAVTKGLNPDAPMKDTAVEWIGIIPVHWLLVPAKSVSTIFIPQRNKPELNADKDGLPWITMEQMQSQHILGSDHWVSHRAANIAGSRPLAMGAVIASCVGNFGDASINLCDVIINQQLQAFIPNDLIRAEFLRFFVGCAKLHFEKIGTAATIPYVNQQGFATLPIALPPLTEQDAIVRSLQRSVSHISHLVDEANTVTDILQERRSALISAAVTGKIDVRNYTPKEAA